MTRRGDTIHRLPLRADASPAPDQRQISEKILGCCECVGKLLKQAHPTCCDGGYRRCSGPAAPRHKRPPLHVPLAALHRDLFCEANPIPVKWAVHALGLIDTGIRLPMTWLSAARRPLVRAAMEEAGLSVTATD